MSSSRTSPHLGFFSCSSTESASPVEDDAEALQSKAYFLREEIQLARNIQASRVHFDSAEESLSPKDIEEFLMQYKTQLDLDSLDLFFYPTLLQRATYHEQQLQNLGKKHSITSCKRLIKELAIKESGSLEIHPLSYELARLEKFHLALSTEISRHQEKVKAGGVMENYVIEAYKRKGNTLADITDKIEKIKRELSIEKLKHTLTATEAAFKEKYNKHTHLFKKEMETFYRQLQLHRPLQEKLATLISSWESKCVELKNLEEPSQHKFEFDQKTPSQPSC